MRLAVIDLGTNSVRFDVHEFHARGEAYQLHREKLMIRLGEGVFLKGRLDHRTAKLCVEAFKSFRQTLEAFRVHRVVAFGTSALREAKDSEKLIKQIRREAKIQIKIISGEEEARLIAQGILRREAGLRGTFALVDIGGGSTEVSVCRGRRIVESASFPLGTARLQQVFLKSSPPVQPKNSKLSAVELLRRHVRSILHYRLVSEDWPRVPRIIGSSGTIRALTKIHKKATGSDRLRREFLHDLVERMSEMERKQILKISGMEPRRVDMILAGAILLEECMDALHADVVESTELSLRDGILDEQMTLLDDLRKSIDRNPFQDLFPLVLRMGTPPSLFRQRIRISEVIFDRLRALHGLSEKWKKFLCAASVLYDLGKTVSPISAKHHSAYIAKNADVPALQKWETEFLSELCFFQGAGKILKKDWPFRKKKAKQRAFIKLLALLRLSVALGFQRTASFHIARVKIERARVTLSLSSRGSLNLEILRADQAKSLFEEVFRRPLIIEKR